MAASKTPANLTSTPEKQKKLYILLGLAVLLGILLMLGSFFMNRSDDGKLLSKLVANQNEILRINEMAAERNLPQNAGQIQANLSAIIRSDLTALEAQRAAITNEKKLPKEIEESVINEDAEADLDAAVQRNDIAREYKKLLKIPLATSAELVVELRRSTHREDLQDLLDQTAEHLRTAEGQLDRL